jgi:hypothetical protein
MNIPITKRWTLQVIWWFPVRGEPLVFVGRYPDREDPLFYRLMLVWVEFRWFDNKWGD